MESKSQIRLENIQGLRAIAAMMVMLLHAFALSQQWDGKPVTAAINSVTHPLGHGGVDIFFVISGFIIVWVSQRAVGDAAPFSAGSVRAALTFALHRVARIYPLFWITLVVIVTLRTLRGREWALEDLWEHPGGLLLLSEPRAHGVAWTLVIEVHFYAIAALLILFAGRYVVQALAGWAVLHAIIVAAAMVAGGARYVFLIPRRCWPPR